MTDYRQQPSTDFLANLLPTLQPGARGIEMLYAERFDTQRPPDPTESPGYPPASLWPLHWELWDMGSAVQATYVDAAQRCGFLAASNPDDAAGNAMVAQLRPWPLLRDEASFDEIFWFTFARIGMYALGGQSPNQGGFQTSGLLVSSTDLLHGGPGPQDGPFILAGLADGFESRNSNWTDHATEASSGSPTVLGQPVYISQVMHWLSGPNTTTVLSRFGTDARGMITLGTDDNDYVYSLKGKPKVVGLGASASSNGAGVELNYARLDYLHIFGGNPQGIQQGVEGGPSYY